MSNELKNILSNSNKDIDNQALLNYLSKQATAEKQHEIEQSMADDPFLNDAIEGLQEIKSGELLPDYVNQLNGELLRNLSEKKKRRTKRRWKDQPYTYVAILLVLIILIVCYELLKRLG